MEVISALVMFTLCLFTQTRVPTQGQIQAQAAQTAQVTLTKPPVVSVPAVVSSAGVTTLPVTVAGISVAIGQPQKPGGLERFNPLDALMFMKAIDDCYSCSVCVSLTGRRSDEAIIFGLFKIQQLNHEVLFRFLCFPLS